MLLYSTFAIARYVSLYISPSFLLFVDLFSSGSCWMIACLLYFISVVGPLFSSLYGPRLLYFHLGDRVYVQHQFPSNTSRCPPQNYKLIAVQMSVSVVCNELQPWMLWTQVDRLFLWLLIDSFSRSRCKGERMKAKLASLPVRILIRLSGLAKEYTVLRSAVQLGLTARSRCQYGYSS